MTRGQLERAALRIREHIDVSTPRDEASRARSELVRRIGEQRSPISRRMVIGWAAAAACLVLVGWLAWSRSAVRAGVSDEQVALTFTVGTGAPGSVGAYVTAEGPTPVLLSFSDGSRVELESAARARVASVARHGAVVVLETGRAQVNVMHRPGTDWSFLAGPYRVSVKGTEFEVGFESATQTLEIRMQSGVVSVEGPGLSHPVEIQGAQRFLHSARPGTSSSALPAASGSPSPPVPPPPPSSGSATSSGARSAGGAGPALSGSGRAESWAALGRDGHYRRVIELAEARGIEATLAGATADDLSALASAARFSGRTALATRAYESLRARFPGSAAAASAAFYLGRISEGGSPSAAVTWYERYVAEAPGGALVAEAMGRRMVALKRAGATGAALAAAREYIERFPSGPYAGVAREMIDASAP